MFERPHTDFVIAHLTDLRSDNAPALEHAVALAVASGAGVVSVHASESFETERPMPEARQVLRRWNLPPDAVVHETCVHRCCDSPVDTILDAFGVLLPDLVVACTHRSTGMERVLRGSVSEAVARNARTAALLIGVNDRGLVGAGGKLELRRVLVPAANADAEADALARLDAFLDRFVGPVPVEVIVLEVGARIPDAGTAPRNVRPGDRWRRIHDHGDVERAIVRAATDNAVDLVAMVSHGHDSFGDAVRGSVTERVLRTLDRPLLAFHVG